MSRADQIPSRTRGLRPRRGHELPGVVAPDATELRLASARARASSTPAASESELRWSESDARPCRVERLESGYQLFSVVYFSLGTLPQKRFGKRELLGDIDGPMPKVCESQPEGFDRKRVLGVSPYGTGNERSTDQAGLERTAMLQNARMPSLLHV